MGCLRMVAVVVGLLALACAEDGVEPGPGDEGSAGDEGGDGKADVPVRGDATFTLRYDTAACRGCVAYWVARTNAPTTRCGDGSDRAECPVRELDLTGLGFGDEEREELDDAAANRTALLRGRLSGTTLTARAAWTALTKARPFGTFVRLVDLGVICISAPCAHLEPLEVNGSGPGRWLSSVDLAWLDLDDAQLAVVDEHLGDRAEGLIVAGFPITDSGYTPDGWTEAPALGATQAYVRLRPR